LVDSGAEKSIIPHSFVPKFLVYPSNVTLSGVGGANIQNLGQCMLNVGIPGLRRSFSVPFITTSTRAILGADFLTEHGLLLDMRKRCLTDPLTQISAKLESQSGICEINVTSSTPPSNSILSLYPSLTQAPNYTTLYKTDIFHEINTTTNQPIFSKARPLGVNKLNCAKKEFDQLLKLNIIRPSSSPWASPLHMVPKPDGTWRPCGDYRRINCVTIPDRYPIPNLQHIHHRLANSVIFSKLDIVKAYHFIPVRPEDIPKTAICTPFGLFEYTRMPFGMRNSAGTFQRFINNVLGDLDFTTAYIDDILIFSKSESEHEKHLHTIFQRLDSVGLKLNANKCQFSKPEVDFLGYAVNAKGIKPPESRIKALHDLPIPRDSKELIRYLGMFGFYQRCIPNFAQIVFPLRELAKEKEFVWSDLHNKSFLSLKSALSSCSELTYPKPKCKLTITSDASAHSIGACLNQHDNFSEEPKPLAFFSRKLSDTEQKYSTFDRELLAVFASEKKWRDVIDGSHTTVFTDHKPIVGAFKSNNSRLSDKHQRQLSFISEYVSDIIHIAGKENVVADTLSRNTISSITCETEPVDLGQIAKHQKESGEDFSKFKEFDIGLHDTKLFCEISHPNPRPVVPSKLRKSIFNHLHNLAHYGTKASYRLIISRYFWPSLKSDVRSWCQECIVCQQNKIGKHTKKQIHDLPFPTNRFATIHMDIVGPLPLTNNTHNENKYLLTIIDSYTRWLEAIPIADITAQTICKEFMLNWVSRFGPPLTLTTDRGSQFCSELAAKMVDMLGIHHIRTCAHNPRANGIVERAHRTLKAALKCRGKNWLNQLPVVLLGMRMKPNENGTSPFSMVTGEQPLVPRIITPNFDLTELSIRLHQLPFNYIPTRKKKIEEQLPEALKSAKFVWLRTDRVRKPLKSPYQGPYKVLEKTDDTFTIEVRGKKSVVSINRVKPAHLVEESEVEKEMTNSSDDEQVAEQRLPQVTKSGRRVKFKEVQEYVYY